MAADFIVVGVMLVMTGVLIWALATRWSSRQRRFGIASLTVWHDWQPSDKQNATEVIIEGRAGRRMGSGEEERNEKQ